MSSKDQTYDFICFTDLAYEFDISKKKEIETKIKRRLKYHKLGKYNQERVDYIRQLKGDLYSEITKGSDSTYYHKSQSSFADLADFDTRRMSIDFHNKYNQVNMDELAAMINFAIYLYHLR
jgi:hypothetical protein